MGRGVQTTVYLKELSFSLRVKLIALWIFPRAWFRARECVEVPHICNSTPTSSRSKNQNIQCEVLLCLLHIYDGGLAVIVTFKDKEHVEMLGKSAVFY